MSRAWGSREFLRFEKRVLASIREYRLTQDAGWLEKSIAALEREIGDPDEATVTDTQVYHAVGWMFPANGNRLRRRTLARLNPGYRISVRRMPRRGVGWRTRILLGGFEITATAPRSAPPFALRVDDREGRVHALPGSNFDSRFELASIDEQRQDLPVGDGEGTVPLGYVDEVMVVPFGGTRGTWFATLVHAHPAVLLDVLDTEQGARFVGAAARVLGTFPSNARWRDRFTIAALGTAGTYTSDLTPLEAVRTDVAVHAPDGHQTLPEPRRIGKVVRWEAGPRPLHRPSPIWNRYENAVLQDGGTLIVGDSLIIFEGSSDPSLFFVAGQWETVHGSLIDRDVVLVQPRPASETRIDEAILLAGRNDDNWFHWLIEYLPRVLFIPDSIPDSVPVVVSTRTPPTGLEALRQLTGREIIAIDSAIAQPFGVLHVLAPQVQVFDTTRVPWSDGLRLNSEALIRLSEALRQGTPPAAGRRVFLQRKARHRGIRNEDALAAIARRHGLEVVDPGALGFREQVELFGSARLLVGASGAVMANYVMMRPGSIVVALTSDQLYDFVLPAALAQVAGVEFSYVTGPSPARLENVDDRNLWIHADFTVDVAAFEAELVRSIALVESSA